MPELQNPTSYQYDILTWSVTFLKNYVFLIGVLLKWVGPSSGFISCKMRHWVWVVDSSSLGYLTNSSFLEDPVASFSYVVTLCDHWSWLSVGPSFHLSCMFNSVPAKPVVSPFARVSAFFLDYWFAQFHNFIFSSETNMCT